MRYGQIKCLLFSLALLCGFSLQAQDVYTSSGRTVKQARNAQKAKEKSFDPGRIIFGGGLGLGFGGGVSIAVKPVVGYRITERLAAGISIGYQYLSIKDYYSFPVTNTQPVTYENYPYRSSIYSGGVWSRFVIWNNVFAHAEYEHNFLSFREYSREWDGAIQANKTVYNNVNYNAPSLLLGGGIRQPLNDRVSIVLMGLYDVLQHEYSPYRNGIDLRFGVNVGF